jgi:hypothetical protein
MRTRTYLSNLDPEINRVRASPEYIVVQDAALHPGTQFVVSTAEILQVGDGVPRLRFSICQAFLRRDLSVQAKLIQSKLFGKIVRVKSKQVVFMRLLFLCFLRRRSR